MARRLKPQSNSVYGLPQPLQDAAEPTLVFHRAPTTADIGYNLGQGWLNDVAQIYYILAGVAGGVATWVAQNAAAGAVMTVTGDAGGAQSPVVGDIQVVGDGVNLSTAGAAGVITISETATPTFTSVTTDGLIVTSGGAADTAGKTTLVAGTKTVATTAVTASSLIFVTVQSLGTVATPMAMTIENVVAGASFDITSSDATDTSVVAWFIVEPV